MGDFNAPPPAAAGHGKHDENTMSQSRLLDDAGYSRMGRLRPTYHYPLTSSKTAHEMHWEMDWDHARSLALEQPHRPEVCNPDKKGADASEMHNRHVLLPAELLHTGFPSGATVFAQLEEHDTDGFEDDGQSTPKSVAHNCNFEIHCILESAPTGFVQDVPLLSWGALWPKKNEASLLRLLRKTST